jgi:hypothetical protein
MNNTIIFCLMDIKPYIQTFWLQTLSQKHGPWPAARELSLQLIRFAAHLPLLFSKAACFCALLVSKATMLDFSLCESREALLLP